VSIMKDKLPGEIPWLRGDAPAPAPELPPLPAAAPPAQRLLHEHLRHGSRARREAAAFALALTQPAAAEAVRAFLNKKKTGSPT
jgi:hypothetical protein